MMKLNQKFILVGATRPNNFFHVILPHGTSSGMSSLHFWTWLFMKRNKLYFLKKIDCVVCLFICYCIPHAGGSRHSISSPHDIFKSQLHKLILATTDPEGLASDLFCVDLISHSVKNKVLTTSSLSQCDKASTLLDEFCNYLNENEKLTLFCDILTKQDNPALKRIAEEISTMLSAQCALKLLLLLLLLHACY